MVRSLYDVYLDQLTDKELEELVTEARARKAREHRASIVFLVIFLVCVTTAIYQHLQG